LPIDQKTQAVIWRFTVPGKPMVKVSGRLERILHKMVSLSANERYANAAEVLHDLNSVKKSGHAWLADQRVLVAGLAGLLLTNILSIGWYQRSLNQQQTRQQVELLNTQQISLAEQCHQPIQSPQRGRQNLINLELVINARKVLDACTTLKATAQNQQVLQNQGKALLLLGQSALQLNQKPEAANLLNEAKQKMQKSVDLDTTNPQSNFYLGLVKQLNGESGDKDYSVAANLYLTESATREQAEDYIILSKLAMALDQAGDFKRADRLYEQSISKQPKAIAAQFAANLLYNRGVLNARYKNARNADDFLKSALSLDPKNQFAKEYRDKCLERSEIFSTLCTSPEAALPTILPIYWCKNYPVLAITEKKPRQALCQY
jgi:tetratricopeptide (TPR) repeat protein